MKSGDIESNSRREAQLDITVAISCYNEENFIADTIDHVIRALKATGRSHEVIVVDDASHDRSVRSILEYIRSHPEDAVRLVQNPVNRGRVRIYFETATVAKGKYYRLCCGDDSEPLEALVNIFRCTGLADVVVPYQENHEIAGKSRGRTRISKAFTFLVNQLSGYQLKYYNGMAIHLRANVTRWTPSSYGFGYEADLLVRVLDEGASFVQVRRFSTDRKGGDSSPVNFKNTLSVGYTLLTMAGRRVRRILAGRRPKPVEVLLETSKGGSDR